MTIIMMMITAGSDPGRLGIASSATVRRNSDWPEPRRWRDDIICHGIGYVYHDIRVIQAKPLNPKLWALNPGRRTRGRRGLPLRSRSRRLDRARPGIGTSESQPGWRKN
jgi:hypothetical protein